MSYFGRIEKTMIFSEHDWIVAKNNKKFNTLKLFEKEIAKDFGIKSKPQLLLSQNADILGVLFCVFKTQNRICQV